MKQNETQSKKQSMKQSMKRSEKKKPTARSLCVRLGVLYVLSFLATTLPLGVLFLSRIDRYVAVPAGGVRLALGGGLVALFLCLKVLGKLRMPSRLTFFAVSLLLCYLLEAVLTDLSLLLWAALIGEVIDAWLLSPWVKRTRERLSRTRQANDTADAIGEVLRKYAREERK